MVCSSNQWQRKAQALTDKMQQQQAKHSAETRELTAVIDGDIMLLNDWVRIHHDVVANRLLAGRTGASILPSPLFARIQSMMGHHAMAFPPAWSNDVRHMLADVAVHEWLPQRYLKKIP